jgi:hypothetical protein
MKEQIIINYGKLAEHSRRLSSMGDCLGRCRDVVAGTGNTLSAMKGAAAEALAGRRFALTALLTELREDTEKAKDRLDEYQRNMGSLLPARDVSSDLVVNQREFQGLIQNLRRLIEQAYMPACLTPTSERYLEYHTRTNGFQTWTEETERYDLYEVEEGNGFVAGRLRGNARNASKDRCHGIIGKIEQMNGNRIEPFFRTDEKLAEKMPASISVLSPKEVRQYVNDFAAAYAEWMPGGMPEAPGMVTWQA